MSNKQFIKSSHIWAVVVAVLFGAIVFAGRAESTPSNMGQNTNNTNTSRNRNQNANTTSTRNTNNSNASGEQTSMAAMSSKDRDFIMDTAMSGLTEVELGRWAAQKGSSDAVKQFGQRMVDDHSKANSELMQLASTKGVTLPTALDEKHQKDVAKLTKLSGADFDKAFSKMMLDDHEKAVKEFEKESTGGGDADLKAFATTTLPTLREHLELARTLPGNEGRGLKNTNSNSGMMNSNSNSNRNSNRNSNSNRNRNSNSNNSNQP